MMNRSTPFPAAGIVVAAALLGPGYAGPPAPATQQPAAHAAAPVSPDRLAAELAHWSEFIAAPHPGDDWNDVRGAAAPLLERAQRAFDDGRRLLALQRLAAARMYLGATEYRDRLPAGRVHDLAAFEAEWSRVGDRLRLDLAPPATDALADVRPAAVRAVAESVLLQVRGYYDASLEYGRNTMPETGFLYLGAARAQKDLAALCRTLSEPETRRAPPLRSIAPEIEALESDLLALYRPPVSIDRHREFISAHATLKEARELDAAGLRHGALLRYLEAALRTAPLRPGRPPAGDSAPERAALAARVDAFAPRLGPGDIDHSIGRMFLEAAQANLPGAAGDADPAAAAAIAGDVLPRYFAALGPATPPPARPAPDATVTLVRWPYT